MNTHSIGYYIKTALIGAAIFCVSYLLATEITIFSKTGDIFVIDVENSIKIGVFMLMIMYFYTLSIGAWAKWEQFAIIPVPTALAVTVVMFLSEQAYAIYIGFSFLVLLEVFLISSSKMKNLLLKFSPTMIMRPTLHGMIFLFSLLSGGLIMLNPTSQDINLGNKIGTMIEEPLKQTVTKQIPAELRPFIVEGIDFKGLAEVEVNKLIEPYKDYIKPILAVLTFFLFQFFGTIAFVIYTVTINIIMWFVFQTKIIKIELVEVQQETLKF